ncbi:MULTISPECIES: hypothetical protein [unclassified Streptomyces]|uniref:Uncharacterized protein n=1 Tax=Streptomyces sp. NBC_00060 TaxID=2975636 RepID=A0AAU2HCD5_9ACTN
MFLDTASASLAAPTGVVFSDGTAIVGAGASASAGRTEFDQPGCPAMEGYCGLTDTAWERIKDLLPRRAVAASISAGRTR